LAKFIKILAASVGGGLVLGAGIRLGEALASQLPVSGMESGNRLAVRLGELENRLLSLETESPEAVGSVRTQVDSEGPQIDVVSQTALRLRGELREWLDESVTVRMAEVETRLRTESERGQRQMLDAFAESVQTRVIQRISRLEEEVASQSAAMSDLRECSLRTERSVHKLLGGLDRLIVKNMPAAEAGEDLNPRPAAGSDTPAAVTSVPPAGPEPPPVIEPPPFEAPPKSSRWRIFG
jgi:uncharacterized coiled-coil protein SlyX